MAMRTPWGTAQTEQTLAEGVIKVDTARHGGIKLDAARNRKVHPAWRRAGGWYEEDDDWAIVAVTFPNLFSEAQRVEAHRLVKDYQPDEYERVFGVKLLTAESHTLQERAFHAEHAGRWLTIAAWGHGNNMWDRAPVPEGMVGVAATIDGRRTDGVEERWFLIPAEEYRTRGRWLFPVDEARHEAWPEAEPAHA